jgi:hypothetical protein
MGAYISEKGYKTLDRLLENETVKKDLQEIAVQCSAGSRWGYIKHKYLWWLPFDMNSYQKKDEELLALVQSKIRTFGSNFYHRFEEKQIDSLASYIADYGKKPGILDKVLGDPKNPSGQPGKLRDFLRSVLAGIFLASLVLGILMILSKLAFISFIAPPFLVFMFPVACLAYYAWAKLYDSLSFKNSDDNPLNSKAGEMVAPEQRKSPTRHNTTPELLNTGPLARVVGSDPPSPSPRPPAPDSGSSTLAGSVSQSGPPLSTPRTP